MKRKKTFKSFWMTTDEKFATVKRVKNETAKKQAYKEDDDKVAKEAVSKNKKLKAKKKPRIRAIKATLSCKMMKK